MRATRLAFTHISTLNRAQHSLRHGHSALDHTQTRAQRSHMGSLEARGWMLAEDRDSASPGFCGPLWVWG